MSNYRQNIYRFRSIEFVAIYFPVSHAFAVPLPPSALISFVLFRVQVAFAYKIDSGTH